MKRCPFCAEEIQDAAIVCRFCGRDLATDALKAVASAAAAGESPAIVAAAEAATRSPWTTPKVVGVIAVAILFLIVVGAVRNAIDGPSSGTSIRETRRTLNVDVAWSGLELQVRNAGSPDAERRTITVYVNGTPPFAYRADCEFPAVGNSVRIPLTRFVDRDGNRFNRFAKAVTQAWVGGAGYDYAEFGK